MSENELLLRACGCAIGKLMEKGSSSSVAIYDGTKHVTISWDEVLSKLEEKLCNGEQMMQITIDKENPTNGDVIKAVFPDNPIDVFIHDVNIRDRLNVVAHFDLEWWNAPYKAESEETE